MKDTSMNDHTNSSASHGGDASDAEIVFATQKHRMGLFIRTIGIKRARANRPRQHRIQFQALHLLGEPTEHRMMCRDPH